MKSLKINLLPKKSMKEKILKSINIVAQVALILNMSMVGVLFTPKMADAVETEALMEIENQPNIPPPLSATSSGYTISLTAPTPPTASNTFVWNLDGIKPGPAQEISHVIIDGCWNKSDINQGASSVTNGRLVFNPDGSVKVDDLQDNLLPIDITLVFNSTRASDGTVDLGIKAGRNYLPHLSTAGPNCQTPPADNPELPQSCGLDMAIVIDSSGSIDNNELAQMKNAFKDFVDAFLPATPTQMSVTDFDSTAKVLQPFTDDITSIKNAINTPGSGGCTNWEDALIKAHSTYDPRPGKPDLVVFASDGNANTIVGGGPCHAGETLAVEKAVDAANAIKNDGIRILALGIGNHMDLDNLKAISGPNVNTGDVNVDVITTDFANMASDLADYANTLCGGKILVQKQIDLNGDGQADLDGSNPDPALAGWQFDVNGDSQTTTETGSLTFDADAGTYDVTETVKPMHDLENAYCLKGTDSVGTFNPNTNAVEGINLGDEETVSCYFINHPLTCDLQLTKSVDKNMASPGETLIYTLEYINNGDGNCNGAGVKIYDNLDPNLTYNGIHTENVEGDTDGQGIEFLGNFNGTDPVANLNVVSPGESGTITFEATIKTPQDCGDFDIPNQATIRSNQTDIPSNEVNTHVNMICHGSLRVEKYVDNGDTTPDQWDFTIDGYGTKSPNPGENFVIFEQLPEGSYTVTESDNVPNYHLVSTTCNNVSIVPDEQTTCEFHNAHDEGNLTINKEIDTDGDGDIDETNPGGWTWDLDGGNQNYSMGSTQTVFTGNHTVTEDQQADYHSTGWDCSNQTSGSGETLTVDVPLAGVTCTFTNVRDTGTLTVIKHVVGGTAQASAWEMHIKQGTTDLYTFPGSENGESKMLVTGNYNVYESGGPTDYTLTYSGDCDSNGNVTINKDDHKTCILTNARDTGTIRGMKFHDRDGDGIKDPEDHGLSNWTIKLDNGNGWSTTATTDHNGNYVFNNVPTGNYIVSEVLKDNWVNTTPRQVSVTVTKDHEVVVNFGNFKYGSISGYKYDDSNGNGVWDPGEPPLEDWEICLNNNDSDDSDDSNSKCTFTDANGYYEFTNLMAGTYSLSETLKPGWTQTEAPSDVYIESGTISENNNFGNFKNVNITVCKYVDMNGDGDITSDPLYLEEGGWGVYLNGDLQYTSQGCYTYTDIGPGSYSVTEELKEGWTKTYPATDGYYIDALSGNDVTVNFGNFKNVTIRAYKYNDLNGNGVKDAEDVAIEGWGITLNGAQEQLTDVNGMVSWTVTAGGTYTVAEEDRTGWAHTNNNSVEVTVSSGDQDKIVEFLNFQNGKISGYKYDDSETPLNGWEICISGGYTDGETDVDFGVSCVLTGDGEWPDGYYEFTGLEAGTYTITETMQDGWEAVDPATGEYTDIKITSGYEGQYDFTNRRIYPDLVIEKNDGLNEAEPGDALAYTIVVTNQGEYKAEGITVVDTLPDYLTYVSDTSGVTVSQTDNVLRWEFPTMVLGVGESITFKVNAQIDEQMPEGTTTLHNVVEVSTDSKETNTDNNDDYDDTDVTVTPPVLNPALVIEKTVDTKVVNPSDVITYTVKITNTGEADALNVVLTDTLPEGFTFVADGERTKTWKLGNLAIGKSTTVTYQVLVGPDVDAGFHDNLAEAKADNHDKISDLETVEVKIPTVLGEEAEPALTIAKEVDVEFANPGSTVTYTVTVTNEGEGAAENVKLTDTLPDGLAFKNTGKQTHTWELGLFAPGQSKTIIYEVVVGNNVAAGIYENLAIASADNHPDVTAKTPLEVRVPEVKGAETGENIFWYLLIGFTLIASGIFVLRQKNPQPHQINNR